MKAKIAYLSGLIAWACVASAAWAEPPDGAIPPQSDDKADQIFKAMDTNGDGQISLDEFRARVPKLVQRLRQQEDKPKPPADRPGPKDRPPQAVAKPPMPPDMDARLAALIDRKVQEALDRRLGEIKKRLPEMIGRGMRGDGPPDRPGMRGQFRGERWPLLRREGMRRMWRAWCDGQTCDRMGPPERRDGWEKSGPRNPSGDGFGPWNRRQTEGRDGWGGGGRFEQRWGRGPLGPWWWDDDEPGRKQGPPPGADRPEPPGPGRGMP